MIKVFKVALLYFVCCSFAQVFANENDTKKFSALENPLNGFREFIFFPQFHAAKSQADKVQFIIDKELNRFGSIIKKQMVVKTNNTNAVDLSSFESGNFLTFEIKDVVDSKGNQLGFVCASLNFSTNVTVDKTKKDCNLNVWSFQCFFKGDLEKNLEQFTANALNILLQKFNADYLSVNSGKPVFVLTDS